ncbi:unnamed protein product [Cylicocyclus nassatus]|uniref:THIF-type NAD/FAD binding fold domain-containing protein n=1 Tax=Cylicocyclus nassatus TaxID=53992 RepID=A0AA36DMD9_CYLNA|nr:unnamed protein product [Cylicocyclus nassatus]
MSIGSAPDSSGDASGGGSETLTKAETEVYDRQIRLWGMEAQNKLRAANVLLCGLSGVGAEISKNLILCGIHSLTLADEKNVVQDDLESNFLLENDSVGQNRARASSHKAQALNPMVKLEILETSVSNMTIDFVSKFTLVVLCDQKYPDVVFWNGKCHERNVGFIACSVFGWMGYSFFDFNNHFFSSAPVTKKDAVCDGDGAASSSFLNAIDVDAENVIERKKFSYPTIEEAFNVDWSKKQYVRKSRRLIPCSYFPLKAMLRAQKEEKLGDDEETNVKVLGELWTEEVLKANHELENQTVQADTFEYFFGPQLSPVCAIVGGLAGQEAIKAMSENERPLQNIFIYSALDSSGTMCNFPPP